MPRKLPPSAYAVPRKSGTSRRSSVNAFGTNRLQKWRMPEGGTPLAQFAAQFQHDAARKFRDLLNQSQFGSIAEFARNTPEISYERLRAILTGDMWMRIEDIALLSRQLNVRPIVEFRAQTFEKKEKE